MRVGLILPALNEEEALPLVLDELPRDLIDRLVVVDNGSTDATPERARAGGAEVVREPVRGYGRACLAGIARLFEERPGEGEQAVGPAARGGASGAPLADGDIVAFLDADHSDYAEELALIVEPLLAGRADMVIGSRVAGGASMEALLPQAWFGNRLACFLMRTLFDAHYSDLGPFRALRVDALRHLSMEDEDFGWTIEMQLKAKSAELIVEEVPVRYRARIGTSKITGTLSGTLRAGFKILSWIARWRLGSRRRAQIPRFRRSAPGGSR